MIKDRNIRNKRAYHFLLGGLLYTTVLGGTVGQPELADCDAQVAVIDSLFTLYDQAGDRAWSDLDPLVARAHECYGDARTAAHAELFDYETYFLMMQRRFTEGEQAFDRFFADFAMVAEPKVLAGMHLRRGYMHERGGSTAAMLAEYGRAAAMADRLAPLDAARALRSAGEQYWMVNDLETAGHYLAAAESLLVQHYPEDTVRLGQALGVVRLRRSNVLLDRGKRGFVAPHDAAEAALPLLQSALQLIPPTPVEAFFRINIYLSLVEVQWNLGEPEKALSYLAEAHSLSSWVRGTYPQLVSYVWQQDAHTQYLLGHYTQAREAYTKAMEEAQAANEREELWRSLVGLGEVAEAEAAARPEDGYHEAEAYFRHAITVGEAIRRTYGTHDWSAAAWEEKQKPYHELTRVLLRQGRPDEAFLLLDETRARYLRDLRASSQLRARLSAVDAERLDSLFETLDDVRFRLSDQTLSLADRVELDAQEVTLQQQADSLTGAARNDVEPVSLVDIQRALQPRGQVLLTYFLDGNRPTAFVVRSDTFVAVPLNVSTETLRAQVGHLDGLGDDDPEASLNLTPLHALYQELYAPVAVFVPKGAPLVVVPDGPLAQVPFGLLLSQRHPPFDYATAPYLLRDHPIAVELAAALLVEPPVTAERPLSLLALGRSRFDGPDPASPAERQGAGLGDLPHVEDEIRHLRRQVGDSRFVVNEEATEAFFDAHRNEARVIHLASHALVNAQLPLYSRVVLWNSPEARDDGTLYLYELQSHPLNADLVTLSGCSTARGRSRVGEGMMGLQYAFRAAGARATLATLWQVEDEATSELMDGFYRGLRRNLPKDEALRQAQLAYLDRHPGHAASPFFWAAPVLYGDSAPVLLAPSDPALVRWIAAGLLLLLGGIFLPRLMARRRERAGEREKG